jgi:hypothetical protein
LNKLLLLPRIRSKPKFPASLKKEKILSLPNKTWVLVAPSSNQACSAASTPKNQLSDSSMLQV